jgi:hypothetical protein
VGEAPTEEDGERCRTNIAAAKAINPHNESVRHTQFLAHESASLRDCLLFDYFPFPAQVLLMEMEIINNEGRTEDALEILDQVQRLPHAIPGDCTIYCLRASVLVNKVHACLR